MKQCRKCLIHQEDESFEKGRHVCRDCRKLQHRYNPSTQKAYREKNKRRISSYYKEYYSLNRKKKLETNRRYIVSRLREDKEFHLQFTIRRGVNRSLKEHKNAKTLVYIGCDWRELELHLGPKPEGIVHIDHICPLAQARTTEEMILLWNYRNLRWLSAKENMSKGASWTLEGHILCWEILGRDWED